MSEVKNIPRLRFPEFNDHWGLKTLGSLGKIINGITYNPTQIQEDGVLVLRSSNIQNGRLSFEDNVYISVEKYNPVKKNDILICVRNGSQRLIGKNALIYKDFENMGFGAFMTIYRSERNPFLYHWFDTEKYYKEVHKNLGATINSINGSDLKKFKVPFPSLPEQQKIADFLTAVDKRIELLEKKKTLLETYKKGVMKKIFNQEIRFKDDNGIDFPDWEEKRLDEISKIYQPKTISQNQFTENGYVVYGANGPIGFYSEYNHETPQVVVTCRGNSCGTVNITTPKSWITGNGMVVNVDDNPKVSKNFIYFYLVNDNLTYLITGSGQPQITGDLKNHKINIPTEIEQVKISKFLSSIDQQLELLGTQIDKSKTWKKGLLQKMFV